MPMLSRKIFATNSQKYFFLCDVWFLGQIVYFKIEHPQSFYLVNVVWYFKIAQLPEQFNQGSVLCSKSPALLSHKKIELSYFSGTIFSLGGSATGEKRKKIAKLGEKQLNSSFFGPNSKQHCCKKSLTGGRVTAGDQY